MTAMADTHPLTSTEILDRLISFDTTSRNSNLPLIGWIQGPIWTHGLGLSYRLSHDASGERANLHAVIGQARLRAASPSPGHVDTVPVDGQAWTQQTRFKLRAEGGRLVGRGAADMKGFVACCLAAVPDVPSRRVAPARSICSSPMTKNWIARVPGG